MFEGCQRRRMVLGIALLGALTVFVLVVESHWAEGPIAKKRFANPAIENNSTCWKDGPYEIVNDCHPCTAFEIKSENIKVCKLTSYKEILRCGNGEMVTRSCDKIAWLEERKFWKFEGLSFVVSVLATLGVMYRKKTLDRRMMRRVQRQLANSV